MTAKDKFRVDVIIMLINLWRRSGCILSLRWMGEFKINHPDLYSIALERA